MRGGGSEGRREEEGSHSEGKCCSSWVTPFHYLITHLRRSESKIRPCIVFCHCLNGTSSAIHLLDTEQSFPETNPESDPETSSDSDKDL